MVHLTQTQSRQRECGRKRELHREPLEITCYYSGEWLFLVSGTGIIVEPVLNYYFRLCLSSILFFGVLLPEQHKKHGKNLFLTKSREKTQKNENIDFVIN